MNAAHSRKPGEEAQAPSEFEGEIREFIRRDVGHLRRAPTEASEQAANNIPDPLLLSRSKETSDDPACIREQLNRQASYLHTHKAAINELFVRVALTWILRGAQRCSIR